MLTKFFGSIVRMRQRYVKPLLFLAAAFAAMRNYATEKTGEKYTSYDESTKEMLRNICTNTTIPSDNKPLGLQLVPMDFSFVPSSCKSEKAACETDMKNWKTMIDIIGEKKDPLGTIRTEQFEKFNHWQNQSRSTMFRIMGSLNSEELQREVASLGDQLQKIKKSHMFAQIIHRLGFGRCGELSSLAAIKILREAQRQRLHLTIQMVQLDSSFNFGLMQGHVYLLINANLKDVEINQDIERTKAYLDSIKQGQICDLWHDGKFIEYNQDTSGFYSADAFWDSVKVTTLQFDWKKLATLPKQVINYFCDELSKLELAEEEAGEPFKVCKK